MRVLLLGASGFIGSAVAARLVRDGHAVVGVGRSDAGPLQPVHLDDVVDTVALFLKPGAPARQIVELVGPRQYGFYDLVGSVRRWMRWPPAKAISMPGWLAGLAYRAGDLAALLGWKPPIRSTTRVEIRYGAVGDPANRTRLTEMVPRDIEAALAHEPASVQERWFVRLYILKALVFGIFGAFWIATGLISLGPGWDIGTSYVRKGGAGPELAAAATVAGALADILIGMAIIYRPTARYGLYAAFLISIAYAVIGTILVPRLWIDPLGPMLKIWPIMVLNLVALSIVDDR